MMNCPETLRVTVASERRVAAPRFKLAARLIAHKMAAPLNRPALEVSSGSDARLPANKIIELDCLARRARTNHSLEPEDLAGLGSDLAGLLSALALFVSLAEAAVGGLSFLADSL